MIRVLLADDHPVLRRGLKEIVMTTPGFTVVAECGDGREALAQLRSHICDIAVLDISMPSMSGLEVLSTARAEGLPARIIILSMHDEDKFALRAFKAGASAYLTKSRAAEELTVALARVGAGGTYVTESLAATMASMLSAAPGPVVPDELHKHLSDREMQIMLRLAKGSRIKEIAQEMFLSPKTVTTYRARLLGKLHCRSNAEVARYAAEHCLVE